MKFNRVCIMGMGYIGFPTACMFASHGMSVTGVDINPQIVSRLKAGNVHIY